jgi:DNA-binding GntR family transcriptional regulator
MATKLLNLDELEVGVEKSVVIGGVTHVMVPLSVESYIQQVKRLEQIRAADDEAASAEDNLFFMIDSILSAFPSMKREDLTRLSFVHLRKLTDYINSDLEAETEEGNVN